MANLMPEVAKLLGVEIGEPFYILQNGKHRCIYSDNDLYKITEEGLANINNTDGCYEYHSHCRVILTDLLLGKCSVEKLPWEPQEGDMYYILNTRALFIESFMWDNGTFDYLAKNMGIIYRTKAEAEAHLEDDYKKLTGKKLAED